MCIDRYIFLNVYFSFCIVAFYIYFIHKYIVSPVRLFMPNQYLADWLLHYLMSLAIRWDKVLSASMWSYFHGLNSCRGFFYFTSESRSSGVCCPTTWLFYLLLIWLGFFNHVALTYWLKSWRVGANCTGLFCDTWGEEWAMSQRGFFDSFWAKLSWLSAIILVPAIQCTMECAWTGPGTPKNFHSSVS